ncbi:MULTISPECIES: hypothetical protein [unclassified Mesorhizobium]|uniref:hypothetical protein n=1 Tax=unclassified Mesorhizobium TaxID=325217 RepID=UPI003339BE65
MKSGLMVLVDLFSLLTMAMFSVFVITADVKTSETNNADGLTIVEISLTPINEQADAVSIAEMMELGVRLVDSAGDLVRPESRALRVETVVVPDGAIVTMEGITTDLGLRVDIKRIKSPVAFLSNYNVRIVQVLGGSGNGISFDNVQLGGWTVAALKLG